MERSTSPVSLRNGARNWRRRQSQFEMLPHHFKINEKIDALIIRPNDIQTKCTILYSHDSSERIDTIEQWLTSLSLLLHCDIIAYEFPGYASEGVEYSDTLAAETITHVFTHIVEGMQKNPKEIVLLGNGAGCGITLYLSYEIRKTYQISGVILINPIVNAGIFTRSPFHNASHIKKVVANVAIIFGEEIQEIRYIRKLYSLIQNRAGLSIVDGAGNDIRETHSDLLTDEISKCICQFIPEMESFFNGEELEKKRPEKYQANPTVEISTFLKQRNLQHLTDLFISFGYIKVEHFKTMIPEEVDYLGLDEKDLVAFKQLITDAQADESLFAVEIKRQPLPVSPRFNVSMESQKEKMKDLEYRNRRKSMRDFVSAPFGKKKRQTMNLEEPIPNASLNDTINETQQQRELELMKSNSVDFAPLESTPVVKEETRKKRRSFLFTGRREKISALSFSESESPSMNKMSHSTTDIQKINDLKDDETTLKDNSKEKKEKKPLYKRNSISFSFHSKTVKQIEIKDDEKETKDTLSPSIQTNNNNNLNNNSTDTSNTNSNKNRSGATTPIKERAKTTVIEIKSSDNEKEAPRKKETGKLIKIIRLKSEDVSKQKESKENNDNIDESKELK